MKIASSHWMIACMCALTLLTGASHAQKSAENPAPSSSGQCRPGPWGKLIYHEAYLEASADLISYYPLPSTTPCWTIDEPSYNEFVTLLESTSIPATDRNAFLAEGRAVKINGNVCLFPSSKVVVALSHADRQKIYYFLGKRKENEYIANPVFFGRTGAEKWMRGTTLSPKIQDLIRKLAWQRGKATVFSDIEILLGSAESNEEAQEIFRTCTRTRTLMLQLVIEKDTAVQEVRNYWVKGQNKKRILPFLDSMRGAAIDSPIYCDICHLFTPYVRQLFYTYPDMSLAKNGRFPDCHWTSLNFFNYAPRDYYLNTKLAADAVLRDYTKITQPYEFGDVLMFLSKDGVATHSCVYVADDIVFTKNGENVVSPWLLTRLEEVQDIYQYDDTVSIQAFRKKDLGGGIKTPPTTSSK